MKASTVGIAGAIVTTAVSGVGFMFWSQTEDITPGFTASPSTVSSGQTFVIDRGSNDCAPIDPENYVWFRETFFGRWQQTHVGERQEIRNWYDLGDKEYVFSTECQFGPVELSVPDNVTWSPVMVCSAGRLDECAEVQVR